MNFFTKSATALAVAAIYAGSASAAVSIPSGVGAKVYATELVNATTVFNNTGVSAPGVTTTAGNLDATTTLGFGVSLNQTRFIRLELTGATFAAGAPDVWVTEGSDVTGPVGSNVAVSLTGANVYIFQITATANYTQNAIVSVKMPASLTATGASPANLKISLFEDAPSANNNLITGLLSSQNANLWNTSAGLKWQLTPGTVEAKVANLFKSFDNAGSVLIGTLGSLTLGVNNMPEVLDPADGVQVILADLISSANVVVTGDFGAVGSVFLESSFCGSSVSGGGIAGVLTNSNQTATFAVTSAGVTANLCYAVNGTTPITRQTVATGNAIKAALDVTANPSPVSTAADVAAATVGQITRDGTTLRFTSIRGVSGVASYIQLANQSSLATSYEATCYGYSTAGGTAGSTATALMTWAGNGGNIAANNHVSPLTAAVCPTGPGGVVPASVVINVASPAGTVFGAMRRVNITTGVATDVPAISDYLY